MNDTMNDTINVHRMAARGTRRARCMILHGLGDSHMGMAGLAAELAIEGVEFILPDAPDAYFGMGYSWYTIPQQFFTEGAAMDRDKLVEQCRPEVLRSRALVHRVLDALHEEAPGEPIVLGGFSQGGLIALDAGFSWPRPIAALFTLSSYFPEAATALRDTPQRADLPVFVGHGDADPVVDYAYAGETEAALRKHGVPVTFRTYRGMAHAVCPQELADLRAFIEQSCADA